MNLLPRWGVYEGEQLLCLHWTPWGAQKCLVRSALAAFNARESSPADQEIRRVQ